MKTKILGILVLSVMMMVSVGAMVSATRTIDSVLLNGGTSVSVVSGNSVSTTVKVTTTLDGRDGSSDNWKSTKYLIEGQSSWTCVDTSNEEYSNTYTKSFSITIPSLTVGSYDFSVIAYQNEGCSDSGSNTYTLTDGIVVQPVCGNGVIEGTESCDGSNLGTATCASVMGTGYTGTLSCSSCSFVTTNCVAPTCTLTITDPDAGSYYKDNIPISWTKGTYCIGADYDLWYQLGSCSLTGTWEKFQNNLAAMSYSWDSNLNGQYCIRLEEENNQASVTTSGLFYIDNTAPTVKANGAYTCDEGHSVTLVSTGTSDSGSEIASYSWKVDGTELGTDSSYTYNCLDGYAQYPVVLTVTDKAGNSASDSSTVTISNVAPVISSLAVSPNSIDEGSSTTLTATVSDVAADLPLSYTINWGDGTTTETGTSSGSISATHIYADDDADDKYTITLSVNDGDSGTDSETVDITVLNKNPVAIITGPSTGNEGLDVTLTGSETDVGTLDTHTFAWDLDGDSDYDGGTGTTASVSCVDEETITVKLQVTDKDGGIGTATHTVTCKNVAPVISSLAVSPNSIDEGSSTTLTATVSDVAADLPLSYTINWGDGTTDTSGTTSGLISVTHTYADDDADDKYTITLSVNDGDSGTDSKTVDITVLNVAPVVDAGTNQSTTNGTTISFTGSATDVGTPEVFTYTWDFGDGSTDVVGLTASHVYPAKGTYTVTLTVTDGDGGTGTDILTVTVYDYNIALTSGWNLISIPLVPENTDLEEVFSGIQCDIDKIWAYEYNETTGKNEWSYKSAETTGSCDWIAGNLEDVIPGYGFYVHVTENTTLYLDGEKGYTVEEGVSSLPNVYLTPGWNLIGHYGLHDVLKSAETNDLEGNDELTDLANVNIFNGNLYSVSTLVPTKGYWAFIVGEDVVGYAPSTADYE